MDTFTRAYITAALWSSTGDDDKPLDDTYSPEDIAPEAMAQIEADCAAFLASNADDIISDLERAGHDFWLTRNEHGAGFWDGGWPEPAATRLDNASKLAGQCDLYVGDDGKLYVYPVGRCPASSQIG